MLTKGVKEEFRELMELRKSGRLNSYHPISQRVILVAELTDCIEALAESLGSEDPQVLKKELTAAAQSAFDDYVVPYDIPQLSQVAEMWVEATVRNAAIPAVVNAAVDYAQQKLS